MGCNCASKEKIEQLYKIYGEKVKPSVPTTLSFKLKNLFTKILIYLIVIPLLPLMVGYVCYKRFFAKDKRISIKKLLRIKGNKHVDDEIIKRIIESHKSEQIDNGE